MEKPCIKCGSPKPRCHTTMKVRGLLCSACNVALGMFQDNADTLFSAIEYLKRSEESDLK